MASGAGRRVEEVEGKLRKKMWSRYRIRVRLGQGNRVEASGHMEDGGVK